ncbi:MAG: DUF6326 family protein [Anaerolineales bacterium]
MSTENMTTTILKDVKINVKVRLAALWTAMMFLFIYVDFFYLYAPGEMEHMIAGYMGPFPTTQGSVLLATILMAIPSLMIFLSVTLKAKANRWTNIIVGLLYIAVVIGGMIGESWVSYLFGSVVELVLTALIVWYAWKWPTQKA